MASCWLFWKGRVKEKRGRRASFGGYDIDDASPASYMFGSKKKKNQVTAVQVMPTHAAQNSTENTTTATKTSSAPTREDALPGTVQTDEEEMMT